MPASLLDLIALKFESQKLIKMQPILQHVIFLYNESI